MAEPEKLDRETIVRTIVDALEPLDCVYAVWEGGAIAFGRFDEWSDIDIHVDAEDDRYEEVFTVTEDALRTLSSIELKYEVPQPTWHGHYQAFYRLKDAGPYLLVDLAVMKHSIQNKFQEPEIHGNLIWHFKKPEASVCPPIDKKEFLAKLEARLKSIRIEFDMFHSFIQKDINRGDPIKALAFYKRLVLKLLVEALLTKYKPYHHDFGIYYIKHDLPPEIVDRLEPLFFVKDLKDLKEKCRSATEWFHEVVDGIDLEEVGRLL